MSISLSNLQQPPLSLAPQILCGTLEGRRMIQTKSRSVKLVISFSQLRISFALTKLNYILMFIFNAGKY